MDNDKKIRVLEMIAKDMEDDAKNFDRQPFNGRTVAEYFGHQGAAIAALADIVKSILMGPVGVTTLGPVNVTTQEVIWVGCKDNKGGER